MKKLLLLLITLTFFGCQSEDVPPGHKAFMFDRTGAMILWSGGSGLQTDQVLGSGTHYTGFYDELKGVNCQDAHYRDPIAVLTKSDMKVEVDLRITYAADCSSSESIQAVINQIGLQQDQSFIQPEQLFSKYMLPVVRESLRNHLANYTIEEVKSVRGELGKAVLKDLNQTIKEKKMPVQVELLNVSNITLPAAIVEKIKEIELARMNANKEVEAQKAAKVRLERELFEAQEQRKVNKEEAQMNKEVKQINAEAQAMELQTLAEAQASQIGKVSRALNPQYLRYLQIEKTTEVQTQMAKSMGKGTTWVLGNNGFLVPPGATSNVSVSP